MDLFVKRFQPERYEMWIEGKDIGCHPEEQGKVSLAPSPYKIEKNHVRKRQIVQITEENNEEEDDEESLPDEGVLEVCKDFYEKAGEAIHEDGNVYFIESVGVSLYCFYLYSKETEW